MPAMAVSASSRCQGDSLTVPAAGLYPGDIAIVAVQLRVSAPGSNGAARYDTLTSNFDQSVKTSHLPGALWR